MLVDAWAALERADWAAAEGLFAMRLE
ncbi:MAG: hypothetical protein QOC86_1243, partial [Gaiellales bacterium]|nr:hypothetical protein [Gaiellales bacterium]